MGEFRVHHVRFFEYQPKPIQCISYSPEARRVAISRSDGTIELWSVEDHWYQEKIIRNPEDWSVEDVCWQGHRLFSATLNGYITEYDLLRLQPKASVSSNAGPIWCLTSDPTQKFLAAGTEEGCVVIFDTEEGVLEYKRCFDKQEGRIMCLAWHVQGDIIVTGGIDNIRLWSVKSGHAVQRLIPGRTQKQQETIVWCIAVTSDMTIISGDSRGKTCFWNGKQGTLIKSFQSHKADVFCLCVDKSEQSVFTSGVDPLVAQFEYTPTQADSDWKVWVATKSHGQHSHDVRALEIVENNVVSGGIDTNFIIKKLTTEKGQKNWRKIPGIPQHSLVHTAKDANLITLQYHSYIEVWKLGHTNKTSEKNGEVLPLLSKPLKLVQLEGKSGDPIVCSAISNNGQIIAVSDNNAVRVYLLKVADKGMATPEVSLKKLKHKTDLMEDLIPAHKMALTSDGKTLVTATCTGQIQVVTIKSGHLTEVNTITPPNDKPCSLTHLSLNTQGNMVAVADCDNNITVYDINKKQVFCQLPRYRCQACALSFNPDSQNLVIAYTDQMIYEFCVTDNAFSDWSKSTSSQFPRIWMQRHSKINHIDFQQQSPEKIFISDEQLLCVLNKNQRFPKNHEHIYSKQTWENNQNQGHAFHICGKYKYMLHVSVLKDDWLVIVERRPITIMESLPPTLKVKKFGT